MCFVLIRNFFFQILRSDIDREFEFVSSFRRRRANYYVRVRVIYNFMLVFVAAEAWLASSYFLAHRNCNDDDDDAESCNIIFTVCVYIIFFLSLSQENLHRAQFEINSNRETKRKWHSTNQIASGRYFTSNFAL